MISWIVAVLAAVVGSVITVVATYFIQRSRPAVSVDSVSMSKDYPDNEKPVAVDTDLLEKFVVNGPNIKATKGLDAGANEQEWVEGLLAGRKQLDYLIDIFVPSVQTSLEGLRLCAAAKDGNRFRSEIAKNAPRIFLQATVNIIHGNYKLDEIPESDLRDDRVVPLSDGRGVLIRLDGPRTIALTVPTEQLNAVSQPLVLGLARRIAVAIVQDDFDTLLPLVEYLQRDLETRIEVWRSMREQVDRILAPLSRICLAGTLINSGRTAVSFSNRANLVLNLRGFVVGSAPVDDDLDIRLQLGSQQDVLLGQDGNAFRMFDKTQPVTVQPGSSVRFLAVSDKTVDEMPLGRDVQRCYEGGDRGAYFTASVITTEAPEGQAVHSSAFRFRDLQVFAPLPRQNAKVKRSQPVNWIS